MTSDNLTLLSKMHNLKRKSKVSSSLHAGWMSLLLLSQECLADVVDVGEMFAIFADAEPSTGTVQ
jgi:hypothetical protein